MASRNRYSAPIPTVGITDQEYGRRISERDTARSKIAELEAEIASDEQREQAAAAEEAARKESEAAIRKNASYLEDQSKDIDVTLTAYPKAREKIENELTGIESEWQSDEKTAQKKEWHGLGAPTAMALEAQTRLPSHKDHWTKKKAELDALDVTAKQTEAKKTQITSLADRYREAKDILDAQEFLKNDALVGGPATNQAALNPKRPPASPPVPQVQPSPAGSQPLSPTPSPTPAIIPSLPPSGTPPPATPLPPPQAPPGGTPPPQAPPVSPTPTTTPPTPVKQAFPKTADNKLWDEDDKAAWRGMDSDQRRVWITSLQKVAQDRTDARLSSLQEAEQKKPIGELTLLEEARRSWQRTSPGITKRLAAAARLIYNIVPEGAKRGNAPPQWTDDAIAWADEAIAENRQSDSLNNAVFAPGKLRWWLANAIPVIAELAADTGLSMATGPAAPATFLALSSAKMAGDQYLDAVSFYQKQGTSKTEAEQMALGEALVVGTISAAINILPAKEFLTKNKLFAKSIRNILLRRGVAGFTAESLPEVGEELTAMAAAAGFRNDPEAFKNWQDRLKANAVLGGLSGTVVDIGQGAISDVTLRSKSASLDEENDGLRNEASQTDYRATAANAADVINRQAVENYKGDLEKDMAGFDPTAGTFPMNINEPLAVLIVKRDTLASISRDNIDTAKAKQMDAAKAQLDALIAQKMVTPEQVDIAVQLTEGFAGRARRAESDIQQAEATIGAEQPGSFLNPADQEARFKARAALNAALREKIAAARGEASPEEAKAIQANIPLAKEISRFPDKQADPNKNGKPNGSSQRQIAIALAKLARGIPLTDAELNLRSGNVSSPGAIFKKDKKTGFVTLTNPETLNNLQKEAPILFQAYTDYETNGRLSQQVPAKAPQAGTQNKKGKRAAADRGKIQRNSQTPGGSGKTYRIPVARRGNEGNPRYISFNAPDTATARKMLADGSAFENDPIQPGETFDAANLIEVPTQAPQQGSPDSSFAPPGTPAPAETDDSQGKVKTGEFGNKGYTATGNPASVPKMITRQMEADLKKRGYTDKEIARMTPQDAWERLQVDPRADKWLRIVEPLRRFFPGGIKVTDKPRNSGGFLFENGTLIISLPDAESQIRSGANARRKAVEEVIHAITVGLEQDRAIDPSGIFNDLPPRLQKFLRSAYNAAAQSENPSWALGHEFLRMVIQGKVGFEEDGTITWSDIGGKLLSEQTSPSLLAKLRDALNAVLEYISNLSSKLRAEGVSESTIASIELAKRAVKDAIASLPRTQAVQENDLQQQTPDDTDSKRENAADTSVPSGRGPESGLARGGPAVEEQVNAPKGQPGSEPMAPSEEGRPRDQGPVAEPEIDEIELARELTDKEWEAAQLPEDELRDFIAGAQIDQPAGTPRMADSSLENLLRYFEGTGRNEKAALVQRELERRAMAEDESANVASANEGKYELLEAIRLLGGIPTTDTKLQGEIDTIREGRTARAPGLFRNAAPPLDRLRSGLADYGFDFTTPSELLEAIGTRLTSGNPQYGTAINDPFALGSQAETPSASANKTLSASRAQKSRQLMAGSVNVEPITALFSQAATADDRATAAGQLLFALDAHTPTQSEARTVPDQPPPQSALTKEQRKLIEDNMGLAGWAAKRYSNLQNIGVAYDDIAQEARLGLVRAAAAFDPTRGIPFGSFAARIIINQLNSNYRKALKRTVREGISANESLSTSEDEGTSLLEQTPAQQLRQRPDTDGLRTLRTLVDKLPEREKTILRAIAEGKDLRTIGRELGMSHEGARKAGAKAANWLKQRLTEAGITSVDDIFPEPEEPTQFTRARRTEPEDEEAYSPEVKTSEEETLDEDLMLASQPDQENAKPEAVVADILSDLSTKAINALSKPEEFQIFRLQNMAEPFIPWVQALGGRIEIDSPRSFYIGIKLPIDTENLDDAKEIKEIRVTVRDHDVAQSTLAHGRLTKVINVNSMDDASAVEHGGSRAVKYLTDELRPYIEWLLENADAETLSGLGVAGSQTSPKTVDFSKDAEVPKEKTSEFSESVEQAIKDVIARTKRPDKTISLEELAAQMRIPVNEVISNLEYDLKHKLGNWRLVEGEYRDVKNYKKSVIVLNGTEYFRIGNIEGPQREISLRSQADNTERESRNDDMQAQMAFLARQAKARGFETVEQFAEQSPKQYGAEAARWRAYHQRNAKGKFLNPLGIRAINRYLYGTEINIPNGLRNGSSENTIRDAISVLERGELSGRPSERGSDTERRASAANERALLLQWATDAGLIIHKLPRRFDLNGDNNKGGREHDAWHDEKTNRWLKATKGTGLTVGVMPKPVFGGWSLEPASSLQYLRRILKWNELFGDDIQLHAIWSDGKNVNIITSQPDISGDVVKQPDIDAAMEDAGFIVVSPGAYYRKSDNVAIFDLHPQNIFRNGEVLVPIDGTIFQPDESMREAIEESRFEYAASKARDVALASQEEPTEKTGKSDSIKTSDGDALYSQSDEIDFAEIDRIEAAALAEVTGNRTIGDARLAFSMDNEIWMALDEWRKAQFQQERDQEWQKAAELIVARYPEFVEDAIRKKGMAGEMLDPVETKVALLLISRLSEDATSTSVRRRVQSLIYAYRNTGSTVARAMRARIDTQRTPEQRWRAFFGNKIYTPPPRIKKQIDSAPSNMAKERHIAELERQLKETASSSATERARLEKELDAARQIATKEAIMDSDYDERIKPLEEKLARMGVTIDDILTGQIELRLMGAKMLRQEVEQLSAIEQRIIKELQMARGTMSLERLSQRLSIPLRDVKRVYTDFVNGRMEDKLTQFFKAKQNTTANIETEGIDTALGSQPDESQRSDAEARAMARKALKMMGLFPVEQLGRIKVRKARPMPPQTSGPEWRRPVGPGLTLPYGRLDLRQPWHGRPQGDEPYMPPKGRSSLFPPKEPPVMPTGEGRTTETGQLDLGETPFEMTGEGRTGKYGLFQEYEQPWNGDVAYLFDPDSVTDKLHLDRTIDTLGDSTWVDYAVEIGISNILSAPVTAITNLTGYAYAAYETSIKRAIEIAINRARVPDAAQKGELLIVAQWLPRSLARALVNASQAWSTESPMFERDVLNEQMEMHLNTQDERRIRSHIPGFGGRIIRTPLRALLAADEFMKTVFGQLNAAAYAYRFAKELGLTGPGVARFIDAQIAGKNSASWQRAVEDSQRISFQTPLRDFRQIKSDGDWSYLEALMRLISDVANADTKGMNFVQQLGVFFFKTIALFTRTPYRLLEEGWKNTLVGSLIDRTTQKREKTIRDPKTGKIIQVTDKAKSATINATIVNAALWTIAIAFMGEGDEDDDDKPILLTGSRPSENPDNTTGVRQLAQRNVPAMSIRMGNVVVSYRRIDPFATMIATTVDMLKEMKEMARGKPSADAMAGAGASLLNQLKEKANLRGFVTMGDALVGEISFPEMAIQQASSWTIPNVIRNPLRNADPLYRDTRSEPLTPEAIAYQFLPIPSMAPPPKLDVYGREAQRPGNWFTRTFVPGMPGDLPEKHPIDAFAERYNLTHPSTKWAPSTPQNTMQRGGQQKEMTAKEYNRFLALRGKLFTRFARETGVLSKQNPTDDDREAITQAGSKATREANKILFSAE